MVYILNIRADRIKMASKPYSICSTLTLYLVVFLKSMGEITPTSENCTCAIDKRLQTADCSFRRLKTIPDCVPNTTESLNVAGNDLMYESGQFHRFFALIYLDLSWNHYTPRNDSFSQLIHLKTLYLNHTNLKEFQTNLWTQPSSLETLSLERSGVSNLPLNFFSFLKNLTYLDLSGNMLTEIRNSDFLETNNLLHLDLSWNMNLVLHNRSFIHLHRLKILHIAACRLKNPSPSILSQLRNLTYLDLSYNIFSEIRNDEFVEFSNLLSLDLRHTFANVILHNHSFKGLYSLKRLYLSECRLRFLAPDLFVPLYNLTYLDLSYNRLKKLRNNQFSNLNNLKVLDLSHNEELVLCNYTFNELPSLRYLVLSECSIRCIGQKIFSKLRNLTYLDLSSNRLAEIRNGQFQNLSNLLYLDLSNNENLTLSAHSFISLSKLNVLTLNDSYISSSQSFHTDVFQPLRSLEYLDLSRSFIFGIEIKCFSFLFMHLPKLKYLDLSANRLKDVPLDTFLSQRRLRHLSLAYNALTEVTFNIRTMPLLETLDFTENKITHIPAYVTKQIEEIAKRTNLTIYLGDNALLCDCNSIDFVSWLRYSHAVYDLNRLKCRFENNSIVSLHLVSEIHEYLQIYCGKLSCDCDRKSFDAWLHNTHIVFHRRNFTCSYPNGTEVNLQENAAVLELVQMKCIAMAVTVGCVTGFVILNLAFGIIVVIWYRRWRLKYLLAIGRRSLNPFHPLEETYIEFEYDAYISYERDSVMSSNTSLHEFVTQRIYPGLQRRGFNVLIRDEFEPGTGLYKVISHSLRRCRKVIALITKDYCKDYWNVFEFNVAVLEGIYTKRQGVLAIAFDDLGAKDLHMDLHAYLKSRPVPFYSSNLTDAVFIDFLSDEIRDIRELE